MSTDIQADKHYDSTPPPPEQKQPKKLTKEKKIVAMFLSNFKTYFQVLWVFSQQLKCCFHDVKYQRGWNGIAMDFRYCRLLHVEYVVCKSLQS